MKITTKKAFTLTLAFIIIYSVFTIEVNFTVSNYSDIIVATTFFFTLFTGFFITRQNDRYSDVADLIVTTDGYYSYLYRITGVIPRLQNRMREILRNHYQKILDSGDWAYHVHHPSNTITETFKLVSSVTEDEMGSPAAGLLGNFCFEVIADLQILRKKMVNLLGEKLTPLHWAIIYVLGLLLMISFNLVPGGSILVDILKILFGTAVFISILLLHMLDGLTIFGENAAEETAKDIFNIIDEKDAEKLNKK